MDEMDHDFLHKIRNHATQTRTFLSNKMRPERERSVCRAFLRTLGVSFDDSELIAPAVEPADVAFRDARFQVRDLLRGRRRGDEWRKKEQQYTDSDRLQDLLEPYSPPAPVEFESLVPEVASELSAKARKYGAGCRDIDALVYLDLEGAFLKADSAIPNTHALECQGWRSVSLLFSPYGVVLLATPDAPAFLRRAAGKVSMGWANIDTLFD